MKTINEANQVIHPVESQWHFELMTTHGFTPETSEARGFVRSYIYARGEQRIKVTTGYSCDHWDDPVNKKCGYWNELERHLVTLIHV